MHFGYLAIDQVEVGETPGREDRGFLGKNKCFEQTSLNCQILYNHGRSLLG